MRKIYLHKRFDSFEISELIFDPAYIETYLIIHSELIYEYEKEKLNLPFFHNTYLDLEYQYY